MNQSPQARRITAEDAADPARLARALSAFLDDTSRSLASGLSLSSFAALDNTITVTMPDRWLSVGSTGSWAKPSTAYYATGYWKDASGTVHLRGTLSNGTYGTTPIFTLPAGFRPAKNTLFSVAQSCPTYQGSGTVEVQSDGDVIAPAITSVQTGTSTYLSLDGISFEAADLSPQAAPAPFPILLSTAGLPAGNRVVAIASCVDLTGGDVAATVPAPRWDIAVVSGVPYARLLDLVGLQPARQYRLRVIVLAL